jgi:hypothetical protein
MTKVQTNAQGKVYVANGKALIATTPGVAYPGLDTDYTNGLATINKGALADYSISDITETGCIAKYTNVYNNFKIFGNPNINFETGVLSGITDSSYINMPKAFPATIANVDMIFKGKIDDFSTTHSVLFNFNNASYSFIVRYTTQKFSCYANAWVEGTNVLSTNTWYWFRVTFDGTTWRGYTLVDDDYILSQLPDISQWRQEWTTTSSMPISNTTCGIGTNAGARAQHWYGSLNLSQAVIYVNGAEWWNAKGNSAIVYSNNIYQQTYGLLNTNIPSGTPELQINYNPVDRNYALGERNAVVASIVGNKSYVWGNGGLLNFSGYSNYPSYSISPNWGFVGTPTYNSSNMSYSGFNQNNYIRTNYDFLMSTTQFAKGFTIQMHIKTPSSWGGSSDHNWVFSQDGNWQYYSFFGILANAKACIKLATGGSELLSMTVSTSLSTNTEYWIRVVKPDTRYFPNDTVMQISTDGENWTTDATASVSSISTNISNGKLRVGAYDGTWYMRGAVYLDGTFIEFNNGDGTTTRVWDLVEQTV